MPSQNGPKHEARAQEEGAGGEEEEDQEHEAESESEGKGEVEGMQKSQAIPALNSLVRSRPGFAIS